jgi:non-ribosomal peptide synthetase-like protein
MSSTTLLMAGGLAPTPRTLLNILQETAAAHPDASALDDGVTQLSYRELMARVISVAASLGHAGVRRGDRVGVRMDSGTHDLYISILAVLAAGAAYVPVDADDPDERATLVFSEANVAGIISRHGVFVPSHSTQTHHLFKGDAPHSSVASQTVVEPPTADDDAWIIFTSGSTGVPKGVAVSHRNAAAFVDAEASMFLQDEPIGPGDRVLAGLSVAFDASCEEMWLAWRYGACLVPAPRSLVRSGVDLGPWLLARGITIVSTVPTLAAMWPGDSLESVRLLIFGGEACPPELVERLAVDGREVWNTYGPTEATVVSCGALVDGTGPVRIGLPLVGWDLAVVDAEGNHVAEGEIGELIIGGVGLARYLDPEKDAEKYAPHDGLGWQRAYRSGDMVKFEAEGLLFVGRVDDQVKVGGRRIELGEIEAALNNLEGVSTSAVTVRKTDAGSTLLVGYLAVAPGTDFDHSVAIARLRDELPAALVPVLTVMDELPVRTSGKVDRVALPWPLPDVDIENSGMTDHEITLAELWHAVLGVPVTDSSINFFDVGGGSLSAALLVAKIRDFDPEFTVADVYAHPRLGAMADVLANRQEALTPARSDYHRVTPIARRVQLLQTVLSLPLFMLAGARWLTYALSAAQVAAWAGVSVVPTVSLWALIPALIILGTPFGRMGIAALIARLVLSGLKPGDYPRGGSTHMRLWFAEQAALHIGAVSLAGAPWIIYYARALGATIDRGVDLHTLPPVTGMLTIGQGASIEPEVDLSGYWIDGDIVRVGGIRIGANATVGARSTLLPGTRLGKGSEIAPGSAVFGRVPSGQLWAGSPAQRVGKTSAWWPKERPPRGTGWVPVFAVASTLFSLMPFIALAAGAAVVYFGISGSRSFEELVARAMLWISPAALVAGFVFALLVLLSVKLLSLGIRPGIYPVRSLPGWCAWSTERILDLARTFLFPIYASLFTPVWLRMLGAKVGKNVEASTVLLIPKLTTIRDEVFLADDTMIAPYGLGGGWIRLGEVEIGRRAFVGNSGLAPAGHRIPKDGLVAVLSTAPRKSKAGSSWLGSPPMRLRRTIAVHDDERTYHPPFGLRLARTLWEMCRFVPVIVTNAIGLGVILALLWVSSLIGPGYTLLASGLVMLVAGITAAAISTVVKWMLVGRIRAREHPLWSSFIWRTEVADTFVELVGAPWFAQFMSGTLGLIWWLRSMGANIGKGVWCDTYWLPEADLVFMEDGSTVNRGCVVQTHLFHDRIMSLGEVRLKAGSTLGPHSVILPAATIGDHGTVGPSSLVMRGEFVPVGSRWSGNPIGPWREVTLGKYFKSVR